MPGTAPTQPGHWSGPLCYDTVFALCTVPHDLNLAGAFADRVMVMSDGKIVTTGTPEQALQPELLSAVFCQEVLVMPHPQTNRPVVLAAYGNDGGGKPGGRRSGG